jgi:pimeloyl-ACP methyl ester carboxylesterase
MRALVISLLAPAALATLALPACRASTSQPGAGPAGVVWPRSHDAADATVASADGVPIRYHSEGSGEPALVFIHGWGGDRGHWAEQVARFSGDREVITLDLAGHGESGRERHDWTIESLGEDVRAVVLALDLRRVILVGHSLGGPVALAAAERLQGRVAAVVGVDTFHDVERRLDPARVQELVERWQKDFAGSAKQLLEAVLPKDCDPALRDRLQAQLAGAPPEIALALLRAQFDYDLAAAFERVHVPIRAINTPPPTTRAAGRRHAADFAAVDLAAMQLGHFPMLTAPDLIDQKLAETLAGLGVAGGAMGPATKPSPSAKPLRTEAAEPPAGSAPRHRAGG